LKKAFLLLIFGLFFCVEAGAWAQEIDHSNFKETEKCFGCHGNADLTVEKDGKAFSLFVDKDSYDESVHGSVPCISCHTFEGPHEYGDALNENVSEKCGNCHTGAAFDYNRSVHKEVDNGPNCAGCHGAHEIMPVANSVSPAHSKNQPQLCGECHQLPSIQYQESFHGKAVALGSEDSPDCTTCHGAHQVLSSDNPASITSEKRTPSLCAKCHEGNVLGKNAVEHYAMSPKGFGAPMYWIKKAFMWLILIVVGFFLVHIVLDLIYKLRTRNS